jgi:hypothetical protein
MTDVTVPEGLSGHSAAEEPDRHLFVDIDADVVAVRPPDR